MTNTSIAMIARWKPVHLGQEPVLRALCDNAQHVIIGIGSCNRYDVRNPFTTSETRAMIDIALRTRSNYEIVEIPDLDDGPRWRALVIATMPRLDCFVTDNPYVTSLLAKDFRIRRPVTLVPSDERVPVDGTMVRRAMAQGDNWRELVSEEIADYIDREGLADRFRREFGLETLAYLRQ